MLWQAGVALACFLALLATADNTSTCRSRDAEILEVRKFEIQTCYMCYSYLHFKFFKEGQKLTSLSEEQKFSLFSNWSHPKVKFSFLDEEGRRKWLQCCHSAVECCELMRITNRKNNFDGCERTWDGWQCWPDTLRNSIQSQPCPAHLYFSSFTADNCPMYAQKTCDANGQWLRKWNPRTEYLSEWTNYTLCSTTGEFKRREHVSIVANSVSIAAVVPSLVIFHLYRQLHGHRITIHKNMLGSLLLHAITVIMFKTMVILREFESPTSILTQNHIWCKTLVLCTKYLRLTNYMWMFCEGFYLHRLISSAFATEDSIVLFYIIGWVAIYAILRGLTTDSNCWALPEENFEWVLYIPCLMSLVVNAAFLVNIIRILLMKLRVTRPSEPSQYRKAVRATLLLVPLFGLHFLFTMYRPPSLGRHCDWVEFYITFDRLLDGLQGAIVALLYCYTNHEVHAVVKRSVHNVVASHMIVPSSMHTSNI